MSDPLAQEVTVTWDSIRALQPCREALEWGQAMYDGTPSINRLRLLRDLMADDKLDWANWLIVRLMTYRQYVAYAIYAAEQVIGLYKAQFPNDPRLQQAILTAKQCLKNPSMKNKKAAEAAGWAAGAAEWAAGAAGWAARAAKWAARASGWAAESAKWAAEAAGWAAGVAGWVAARNQMQRKILRYGLRLLRTR